MTHHESQDLSALLRAVIAARSDVEHARSTKATPGFTAGAAGQRQLLVALEQYAAALARLGRPLPYRLRDEMAMYRAMFSTRRQR